MSLHRPPHNLTPLPPLRRLDILPFIPIHLTVLYTLITNKYSWEAGWLVLIAAVATNGIVWLAGEWSVEWKRWIAYGEGNTHVMVIPKNTQGSGAFIPMKQITPKQRGFEFQRLVFVETKTGEYEELAYPVSETIKSYQDSKGLATDKAIEEQKEIYGLNQLDVPVPNFKDLWIEHAKAPFFVFQLFCVSLWFMDEYWYYSIVTLIMLFMFESTVVLQRLNNFKEFRTTNHASAPVYIFRKNKWVKDVTTNILPGDIIEVVRSEENVPADLLLLRGSCIVNEAILSGESTPQMKESIELLEPTAKLDADSSEYRNSIIFGGTKVLQTTSSASHLPDTPSGGIPAIVLRTGFGTTQGSILRSFLFSTTPAQLEPLYFILFLLIFAIAAAAYVWTHSTKERGKLILECVIIITSVVPPELPMELSLAVNQSLISLSKLSIFCTEPFRLPFSGKIDICCFDKTGTLTGEDLLLEGVGGFGPDPMKLVKTTEVAWETLLTISSCHSLHILPPNTLVGDPMEKATLMATPYRLSSSTTLVAEKFPTIEILRRWQFSSALKRMTVIIECRGAKYVMVKGAPEMLQQMFKNKPDVSIAKAFAKQGGRVISLGWKEIQFRGSVKDVARDTIENDLEFAGYLVFHNPLKPDATSSMKMLRDSGHPCVMITGDNPLTAAHVAKEVGIIDRDCCILDGEETMTWKSIHDEQSFKWSEHVPVEYELCMTGKALGQLMETDVQRLLHILPSIKIWARVSPAQKELIVTSLKESGLVTLMCGDGTNDVGALKQADIGIALLNGSAEDLVKIAEAAKEARRREMVKKQVSVMLGWNLKPPPQLLAQYEEIIADEGKKAKRLEATTDDSAKTLTSREKIAQGMNLADQLMADVEDDIPKLKLGDASVAAPFTSKLSNVIAVCNIIRQGRCTLVTTIQMYKILALNSLISAFCLSVLKLDNVKYGETQATIQALLIAGCFMFLAKGQPLEKLTKEQPHSNIFNKYILTSIMGQFFIHILSLAAVMRMASLTDPDNILDAVSDEPVLPTAAPTPFAPTLLKSATYLMSLSMQLATFAINYQGHPFRESLRENKALWKSLCIVGGITLCATLGIVPELNRWMELVTWPADTWFREQLLGVMLGDWILCAAIEWGAWLAFGRKPRKDLTALRITRNPAKEKARKKNE